MSSGGGKNSSHRFAPLRGHAPAGAPEHEDARALLDAQAASWTEAEANWRALIDPEASLDPPSGIDRAFDGLRAIAAQGATLAMAGRVCLERPTPENRQMLVDLTPRGLRSPERVDAILAAPAEEVPSAVLEHLAAYVDYVEPRQDSFLSIIHHAGPRSHDEPTPEARHGPEAANKTGRPANDNAREAQRLAEMDPTATHRATPEVTPTLADIDLPGAEPLLEPRGEEFDWRRMAMEAALQLHREAADVQRVEPEPAPTDAEHAAATREQTEKRRERQARDLHSVAREVVADAARAKGRERDDEGGREL